MKTTLDLPDDLLMEAKTLAVRRKTTLKAIVESALRREIHPAAEMENPDPEKFEVGPLGFLVIKKRPGSPPMTLEMIRAVQEKIDEEDFQKAMHPIETQSHLGTTATCLPELVEQPDQRTPILMIVGKRD